MSQDVVTQVRDGAEHDALAAALEQAGGSRLAARKLLKMSKSTFFRALLRHPDVAERYPATKGHPDAARAAENARLAKLPAIAVPLPIEVRFQAFHQEHPEVYDELLKVVRRQYRGVGHVGIGCCWEVLRWRLQGSRSGRMRALKLNNTWRSRYARMIQAREPELAHAFRTRRLRG